MNKKTRQEIEKIKNLEAAVVKLTNCIKDNNEKILEQERRFIRLKDYLTFIDTDKYVSKVSLRSEVIPDIPYFLMGQSIIFSFGSTEELQVREVTLATFLKKIEIVSYSVTYDKETSIHTIDLILSEQDGTYQYTYVVSEVKCNSMLLSKNKL